jgi:hypothetical protein
MDSRIRIFHKPVPEHTRENVASLVSRIMATLPRRYGLVVRELACERLVAIER